MTEYIKPIPMPDNVTATFWDAAKERKLLLQQCADCGERQFLPQSCCRGCLSENVDWIETSGMGKIYTFTIVHRPPSAVFREDAPYAVALVELDEGVRMMSNIVGIEPDAVRVDMRVEVVFDDITPSITLPRFRPIQDNRV
jgi:uncharacterized OB-fold protein